MYDWIGILNEDLTYITNILIKLLILKVIITVFLKFTSFLISLF